MRSKGQTDLCFLEPRIWAVPIPNQTADLYERSKKAAPEVNSVPLFFAIFLELGIVRKGLMVAPNYVDLSLAEEAIRRARPCGGSGIISDRIRSLTRAA